MILSCPHPLYVNRAAELGTQLSMWQGLRSFTHDNPEGPAGGLTDRGRHQVILLPYTQVMSLRFGEWSPNTLYLFTTVPATGNAAGMVSK